MSLSKNIGKCKKCGFPMYQCKGHFNAIAEPMSKEQTPITAREFIPKNDNGLYSRRQVEKHAEQYAQAKVEEEVEKLRDELHEEEAKKVEHSLTTLLRMNEDLLNQLKNTVTLEELEEEVVKAYEEGIENALTHDSYIGQVIGIDYYKKQVKPKYE